MAEVIGSELELEAVLGLAPRWSHHTGVVDQHVERAGARRHRRGRSRDRTEVGEVEIDDLEARVRMGGGDLGAGLRRLRGVAAGHQHSRAGAGQRLRRLQSEAAVRAGDEERPAGLVGNVGGRPPGRGRAHLGSSVSLTDPKPRSLIPHHRGCGSGASIR